MHLKTLFHDASFSGAASELLLEGITYGSNLKRTTEKQFCKGLAQRFCNRSNLTLLTKLHNTPSSLAWSLNELI